MNPKKPGRALLFCAAFFLVSAVLIESTWAASRAYIFGLRCNQGDVKFGQHVHNWNNGLRELGWDVNVYCGIPGSPGIDIEGYQGPLNPSILKDFGTEIQPSENALILYIGHSIIENNQYMISRLSLDPSKGSYEFMNASQFIDRIQSLHRIGNQKRYFLLGLGGCYGGQGCIQFLDGSREDTRTCTFSESSELTPGHSWNFLHVMGMELSDLALNQTNAKEFQPYSLIIQPKQPKDGFQFSQILGRSLAKDAASSTVFFNGFGDIDQLSRLSLDVLNGESQNDLSSQIASSKNIIEESQVGQAHINAAKENMKNYLTDVYQRVETYTSSLKKKTLKKNIKTILTRVPLVRETYKRVSEEVAAHQEEALIDGVYAGFYFLQLEHDFHRIASDVNIRLLLEKKREISWEHHSLSRESTPLEVNYFANRLFEHFESFRNLDNHAEFDFFSQRIVQDLFALHEGEYEVFMARLHKYRSFIETYDPETHWAKEMEIRDQWPYTYDDTRHLKNQILGEVAKNAKTECARFSFDMR